MSELFDFDRWMRLAKSEPQRFEELRRQLIEEQINSSSASRQQRLRGLQFYIDAKRRMSGSAMGSCIELSSMMFDHLYKEFLPTMAAFQNSEFESIVPGAPKNSAVVLKFRQ